MEGTVKPLITCCNSISKRLNQGKHWLLQLTPVPTKGSYSVMDLAPEWGKVTSSFPVRWLPNRDTWARNGDMHESMADQGAWVLDGSSLQRPPCTGCVYIRSCRGWFHPMRPPGRIFVTAYDWAWKITQRFLARSQTPQSFCNRSSFTLMKWTYYLFDK